MEVIKKGIDKKYIMTCHKCKSELLFSTEDIIREKCDNWDYDGKYYASIEDKIVCPVCNHHLFPNYRNELEEE